VPASRKHEMVRNKTREDEQKMKGGVANYDHNCHLSKYDQYSMQACNPNSNTSFPVFVCLFICMCEDAYY